MKHVVSKINQLQAEDITTIEKEGKIDVEVNGELITLDANEVEISSQDIEGWLVASSGNITVALDVNISDELKKEGVARELINRIQNMRKDSGFEVTDTINVTIKKDGIVEDAVNENLTYIKTETLTAALELAEVVSEGVDVEFDDVTTKLLITKN